MRQRGAVTIYFLAFTVAIFGLLVMATDVGRFYLIQGELQTAAEAAAVSAATRLTGVMNSRERADDQLTASFDSTTGNDNRFNLRMNQICAGCGSTLLVTTQQDYFSTLIDAQSNANGGQTGGIDWSTGFYPKYVRVQITAEAPLTFGSLLTGDTNRPLITTAAISGVSAPICSACGIEGFAVADRSAGTDALNYGYVPGGFYTLFLVATQRTGGAVTPLPLPGTIASAPYAVLNHIPGGPAELDIDGSLFEFGSTGLANGGGLAIPGVITIDSTETAYVVQGTNTPGQDLLCGLNARFDVDPSQNICGNLAGGQFLSLDPLFTADTDLGALTYAAGQGLQDYATEYDGNFRRILTVAIVDAADSLAVLNFRQFLIEMSVVSPTLTQGLNTALATGAFRAQYIGAPVPVRCGGIGGLCRVSAGIGRTVLH